MRTCLLANFLILSQAVVQKENWHRDKIEVTPEMLGSDLVVELSREARTPSLLLLAKYNESPEYTFDQEREYWVHSANFSDFGAFATNKENSYIRVPSSELAEGTLHVGVYKEDTETASYELSHYSTDSFCEEVCSYRACEDKTCKCEKDEMGYGCEIQASKFEEGREESEILMPKEWRFYFLEIQESVFKVTYECQREKGNMYLVVLKNPKSTADVPSMFKFNVISWFGEGNNYYKLETQTNSDRWNIAAYCESEEFCKSKCKFSFEYELIGEFVWLLVSLLATVALVCCLIPLSIKAMLSLRHRRNAPLQPDQNPLTVEYLDQVSPVKLYKTLEKPGETCSICLDDFDDHDEVRELSCKHFYHKKCLDTWATTHGNCPLCKTTIRPCQVAEQEVNSNLSVEDV